MRREQRGRMLQDRGFGHRSAGGRGCKCTDGDTNTLRSLVQSAAQGNLSAVVRHLVHGLMRVMVDGEGHDSGGWP